MSSADRQLRSGQILVLFTLALIGLLLLAGLTVDGGYALAQRRSAQNAADFAAIAGTRVVGESLTGDYTNGTDGNVRLAVEAALSANGANVGNYTARYVTQAGDVVGQPVGTASIPIGAEGVIVTASTTWDPYFLGIVGIHQWTASADAVAISPGVNVGVGIMPFGVSASTLDAYDNCPLGEDVGSPTSGCATFHLTPGSLNVPGGFGWLKFGCYKKDADNKYYGLGQVPPASNGGCSNSKPFLDGEWGALPTTPGNTYGCCTSVSASTAAGYGNDIGSLPGNKASITDSQTSVDYMETNNLVGWVPIWDYANGNGSNGYYHIIGYAGFQVVHIKGGRDIEGVIRFKEGPGPNGTYDSPDPSLLTSFNGSVELRH